MRRSLEQEREGTLLLGCTAYNVLLLDSFSLS
jgi:hypothetical protein